MTATVIPKGRRLVGAERQTLGRQLAQGYRDGASIRALATQTGRSYGAIHRLLTEAGVELRERGKRARYRRESAHSTAVTANVRGDIL